MKKHLPALRNIVAAVLVGLIGGNTFASEGLSITVGTKSWFNKWTSWDYYAPTPLSAVESLPGASESFTSSNKSSIIPSLSLRYGDFLATGSVFLKSDYSFIGSSGAQFKGKRSEVDFHTGYFLLPTLAATVGYKDVRQDFGSEFKYSGPILGFLASAPLTRGFSLYGNFGLGAMKAKFPAGLRDNSGKSRLNADYYLSEIGLAYSIDARSYIASSKALTATFGYRSQTLATKKFAVGTSYFDPAKSRLTELRDNTEGLSVGINLTF